MTLKGKRTKRQQRRDSLVASANEIFLKLFGDGQDAHVALYRAWALRVAAQARGMRMIILAGSAYWRVAESGERTVFGYQWEGMEAARASLLESKMPVMHVWGYLLHKDEVVDICTRFQPEQAERAGVSWELPHPPDYIWERADKILGKHGAAYVPDEGATKLANLLLEKEAKRLLGERGETDGPTRAVPEVRTGSGVERNGHDGALPD